MRLAHRTRVAHGDTRRAAATPFAALILVLASQPAPLAQQETDAPPPAARPAGTTAAGADEQAAAADPSEEPTLDVTVDVTASLPDIDRLVAAEGLRVGAAEGAQLISAAYIRAQQASTLADALRKTTSVQVDEEGGQQGSVVIIRGLKEDQVSVRVEGAPKNFNQARHGGAGGVWLEPDIYKSIVVVPGVASNVYGNGSLGGVILLETKDPEDVIPAGQAYGANLRTGYESNGESMYLSGDAAYRLNQTAALNATYTRRDTSHYVDGAGRQALGGATGSDDHNLLLKAALTPARAGRLELSYLGLRKDYVARGTQSRGTIVSSVDQFTNVQEDTYTVQYAVNPADRRWFDMNVRGSLHKTARDRRNDGSRETSTWGVDTGYLEISNTSSLVQGRSVLHTLRYGAALSLLGIWLWWPYRRSFRFTRTVPLAWTRSEMLRSHMTGGVVTLVVVLVLCVTGVAITYRDGARAVLGASRISDAGLRESPYYVARDWETWLALARQEMDGELAAVSFPRGRGGGRGDPAGPRYGVVDPAAAIQFRFVTGSDWFGTAGSRVYVDPRQSALIGAVRFGDLPPGQRFYNLIVPLHAGRGTAPAYLAALLLCTGLGHGGGHGPAGRGGTGPGGHGRHGAGGPAAAQPGLLTDPERSLARLSVALTLTEPQQQAVREVMREHDERMRAAILAVLDPRQARRLAGIENGTARE